MIRAAKSGVAMDNQNWTEASLMNARDLLGQLLGSDLTASSGHRVGHALGPEGLQRPGNPLSQLFGQRSGSGGALGGLAETAKSFLGQATGSAKRGDPLAVGGLAALAGAFLGGRGGAVKGAVGGGAMALLGSLAMSALKKWDQGDAQVSSDDIAREAPLGLREPQNQSEEDELERRTMLMVRAMLNAAKADGQVDPSEMERIAGKVRETGGNDEAITLIRRELHGPLDIDGLARDASEPDVAAQVYAASLLAIEVDTPAERDYLQRLAARLNLDPTTVQRLHGALGVPLQA
jgi:uncharacterized membrane protein YebE (DUF533 family)